ncbi:uncharacterized protein LOC120259963 [Dioscorea cayenensis subsp. rotundata]|uniref:Uncharacterized protein LOC120259963 n=1 Tax=Dioscorea cayennensis subsp. rotundata TaxID=55577 RepID=A0AB40B7W6_DIOCR|nr:uncharacterized protein LOC120259963 [Dioscorea cayenensis subsp. rotundata]
MVLVKIIERMMLDADATRVQLGEDATACRDTGRDDEDENESNASGLHDSDYSFNSNEFEEPEEKDPEEDFEEDLEEDLEEHVEEEHEEEGVQKRDQQPIIEADTDEENLAPERPKYADFNEDTDMREPEFKIGMKFRSFQQFREAIRIYGIRNRCVMNFKPNNKKRCKAFCRRAGYPCYLWASPMYKDKAAIQIKSGNLKHECTRDHNIRHVNATWIANNYLEQFRADPSWKITGIIQAVKLNQQADISRLKAWRAKCIALRMLDGDEKSQIRSLYDYRLELLRTHANSTMKFKCSEVVFARMYVCLGPLKAGFLEGYMHIISLDGCFLKGLYGGQLLSAVGIDANDSTYPFAWAIVEKENNENWQWFLSLMDEDLDLNNSHHFAFMADRQKGLIPAIEELFPYSEHSFCGKRDRAGCQSSAKENVGNNDSIDPMAGIDPHVLKEHFVQVDLLINRNPEPGQLSQHLINRTSKPGQLSQQIDIGQLSQQVQCTIGSDPPTERTTMVERRLNMTKLPTISGRNIANTECPSKYVVKEKEHVVQIDKARQKKTPTVLRIPTMRARANDKDGVANKKKKIWVPPGSKGSTTSGDAQ